MRDAIKPGKLPQQEPIMLKISHEGVQHVIRTAAHQIAAHDLWQREDRRFERAEDFVNLSLQRDGDEHRH
jgi:hypothetical protein